MTSYIWRSTTGQQHATTKLGTRAAASSDMIQFDVSSVSDGKYIHQTELSFVIAIGDNEKPQGNVNELQDVGVDSITWTLTGSVNTNSSTTVFATIKKWLLDGKTDAVFTKGRFGLELDDITAYNLIPTGTGSAVEQPRGFLLSSWQWLRDGAAKGKTNFVAVLRFNGDIGITPDYSWETNHA